MKGTMLFAVAMLVPLAAWSGASRARSEDEKAIRHTLQIYFDGHVSGKREVMAGAFHPDARLSWIRDGSYTTRTLDDFLAGLSGKVADDESQRRRRIVSVDMTGTAAVAKLELDYPDVKFTDYMTLLQVADGDWKIVHKSFNVEQKEKAGG
jgi:hypothetical protein